MNRRNALARIAAALAALVAAPRMLQARKEESRNFALLDEVAPEYGRDSFENFSAPHIGDNMFRRHFATKRNAWYHGPPLGERYDEVLQRRDRELSRELTRIALSFWENES